MRWRMCQFYFIFDITTAFYASYMLLPFMCSWCYIGLPWIESATFMSTISSNVRPCTLCIVVAQASVSGSCRCAIFRAMHVYILHETLLHVHPKAPHHAGKLARYGLVWIALMPSCWLSNFTSTLVTVWLSLVTIRTTSPLALLTRPSDTSTLATSITLHQ